MPAVTVVVACRNAAETLSRTLAALLAQVTDLDYEVVVVDDGSTDGSAELAEAVGPPVRVLRQDALGPGPARNRGVAEARSPLIAFADADCFPEPGWLAEGLAALADADLVQGRVVPDRSVTAGPFDRTIRIEHESDLFETANLFIRRELFERLGGFELIIEPRRGKALAEDVWLGWRARRAGARVAFARDAVVQHAVFRRGPVDYLRERGRAGHFPAIVARIPELRAHTLFLHLFLTRRSASFDFAITGLAVTGVTGTWPFAAAALSYATIIAGQAFRARRRGPLVATVGVIADLVTLAALIAGSLRARALVL